MVYDSRKAASYSIAVALPQGQQATRPRLVPFLWGYQNVESPMISPGAEANEQCIWKAEKDIT